MESKPAKWAMQGDPLTIGRALTNLIENAIDHDSDRVVIAVDGHIVAIEPDDPGMPIDRIHPGQSGAAGLSLIRQVMDRYCAHGEMQETFCTGTIMRLELIAELQP